LKDLKGLGSSQMSLEDKLALFKAKGDMSGDHLRHE
jgi:hypothetical protein